MQSHRAAREAALALDQQDEAAEADIRMGPFLFGSCSNREVLQIGNNILRRGSDRLRSETLVPYGSWSARRIAIWATSTSRWPYRRGDRAG
jgi:hypothetical protein